MAESDPSRENEAAVPWGLGSARKWLRRGALLAGLWAVVYFLVPMCLPWPRELLSPPVPSAEIQDKDGQPLRQLLDDRGQRVDRPLAFGEIPKPLIDATVSAEDQRFWTHGGIDFPGVIRAVLDGFEAGRAVSGASTITQQLVKVARGRYSNRTWRDKLKEMAAARKIEMAWTKERILTEYLQRLEYGNQRTGCAAAAQGYFQKPLSDLSLAEAAFLAGLPQAPGRLNPYRNFEAAKKRQEWILERLVVDGKITGAERDRAAAQRLLLRRWTGGFRAPHFVDMLMGTAEWEKIEEAGGPVPTTIDSELQTFCEQAVKSRMARLRSQRAHDAAVVVLDNFSGGVRALVGSPDYFSDEGGQINGAAAPRSAGSSLKPFTYLLALEQGATPATVVDDLPVEFMTPTGVYRPENYDRKSHGPIRYREALANSLNIAAVKVLRRIGGPAVLQGALKDLGFTTLSQAPEHYGLGLTIGNAEVRLVELANAYACLARQGEWRPVRLFRDRDPVGDRHVLYSSESCWLLADILADSQARSRGFGLQSPLRLPFPAAVKTGTSTDFRDNWCVGFTPEFTVAVWVGNFDRQPMNHVSGVSGAAPLWREIMTWLDRRRGVSWYPQPSTIVDADVDPLTGEKIPAEWARRRPSITEHFTVDTVPAVAPADRYDALGRVVLPASYAHWLAGTENWIGADAIAGTQAPTDESSSLQILNPLPGATIILDPDLPEAGSRLRLRASIPGRDVEWLSDSLTIECNTDGTSFAHLTEGRHRIAVRAKSSGQTAEAELTVKGL